MAEEIKKETIEETIEKKEAKEEKETAKTDKNNKQSKTDKEVEKLKEEIAQFNEKYIRLAAEYDNYRKRTIKEKEQTWSDATIDTIKKFLDVADDFERCALADCSDENYKKGIEMILRKFQESVKKIGAEAYGEAGDEFNLDLHNPVMLEENEEKKKNEITQVFQKGYKLGDKIIRYAQVKVANKD